MARILIVDDDPDMNESLCDVVEDLGHEVRSAYTLEDGLREARSLPFDVVFLDVRLPDGNGLTALPRIRQTESRPEVIIVTGYGDADGAELAINNGAWDYINKPASVQEMTLPMIRALQYREKTGTAPPPRALDIEGIVGESPLMRRALEQMAQAAASEANVLVTGETGSGKELFAKAIHRNSRRADGPFVIVDCAALPETLVESMLLGHERGAFTGADRSREGLVRQADGGVLFLDEVGELPLPVQKSFLRVVEERRFRPIGAAEEISSDFRLLAATNRDLDAMVRDGELRKDLFFRLRSLVVEVPPLRRRAEDIPGLAIYHAVRLCRLYGLEPKAFSPEFFKLLELYHWPGNVRELVHTLEQALAASAGAPTLFPTHLPVPIRVKAAQASLPSNGEEAQEAALPSDPLPLDRAGFPALKDLRKAQERHYLERLMSLPGITVKEACDLSGLSRSRLHALLKEHGLGGFRG